MRKWVVKWSNSFLFLPLIINAQTPDAIAEAELAPLKEA